VLKLSPDAFTSIFVWHLTGKLYGALPLTKRDNYYRAHSNSLVP
jgi:hypothetical protein